VIRHSAARVCRVRVAAGGGEALVEVVDDGAAPGLGVPATGNGSGSGGGGHGLAGLRERVTGVGGTLDAGPLAAGGYRLAVRVPVAAAVSA
jgi:two-component system sensor histidine kinase DesK